MPHAIAPFYDPLDPKVIANPYPLFEELRTNTPVFWHEGMRSWCLTRYADCVQVLRDHKTFARDRRGAGNAIAEPNLSVQSLDPPDQTPVRRLFMNALRAQDLSLIEDKAHQLTHRLLTKLSTQPAFDVMRDIAMPVAVDAVAGLLGVAPPKIESFAEISDAIMRSMDAGLDPSTAEPGRIARVALTRLVDSWFNLDSHGLLGDVMRNSKSWTDQELIYVRNTARVMFQGGYSTVTAAIGNVLHTLMTHPEAMRLFRNGSPLEAGVAELIRFDGPVQGSSRVAMSPCVIGGQQLSIGDTIVTLFAAANHDPDQFQKPASLDLMRSPNQHLGYGWGTHSCIGTTAAQAALRGLVGALAKHSTSLHSAGPATRRRTATMRIFATLPAALSA